MGSDENGEVAGDQLNLGGATDTLTCFADTGCIPGPIIP